jgi:hypothetical protein
MTSEDEGPHSTETVTSATNTTGALLYTELLHRTGTTTNFSPDDNVSVAVNGSAFGTPATVANTTPIHQCAKCVARATQLCGRRAEGVDHDGDPSPTWYCSRECQADHRDSHKIQCKLAIDRRQLFQIGALVQHAFYASTKVLWYDEILEVRKIDPFEDDSAQVYLCRRNVRDGPDFPVFPVGALTANGGTLEERDEQAVLAASVSIGNVVSGLLKKLVEGKQVLSGRIELQTLTSPATTPDIKIEEVVIDPKAPRSVRFDRFDAPTFVKKTPTYWIFRATLLGGSTSASEGLSLVIVENRIVVAR